MSLWVSRLGRAVAARGRWESSGQGSAALGSVLLRVSGVGWVGLWAGLRPPGGGWAETTCRRGRLSPGLGCPLGGDIPSRKLGEAANCEVDWSKCLRMECGDLQFRLW